MSMLDPYVPHSQRGVIYFSSVPRDMRPPEVRNHFNEYGSILRMKFVPYPKKERRPGGPLMPLQYKEGWMEYAKADDAATAAARMNGSPVQCKRTRKCYGQLWTVKHMGDFSWDRLVEEQEGKRRVRRAEEVQARRYEKDTNEAYRRLVMEARDKKMARRRQREEDSSKDEEDNHNNNNSTSRGDGEGPDHSTRSADPAAAAPKLKKARRGDDGDDVSASPTDVAKKKKSVAKSVAVDTKKKAKKSNKK